MCVLYVVKLIFKQYIFKSIKETFMKEYFTSVPSLRSTLWSSPIEINISSSVLVLTTPVTTVDKISPVYNNRELIKPMPNTTLLDQARLSFQFGFSMESPHSEVKFCQTSSVSLWGGIHGTWQILCQFLTVGYPNTHLNLDDRNTPHECQIWWCYWIHINPCDYSFPSLSTILAYTFLLWYCLSPDGSMSISCSSLSDSYLRERCWWRRGAFLVWFFSWSHSLSRAWLCFVQLVLVVSWVTLLGIDISHNRSCIIIVIIWPSWELVLFCRFMLCRILHAKMDMLLLCLQHILGFRLQFLWFQAHHS